MEIITHILFWLLTGALALAGLWLAFLLVLALLSRHPAPLPPLPEAPPRILIIVPAHNEEALVADTVRRILAIDDYPRDRALLHVVADNCSDRTAEKAREAGAQCLVRHDPDRIGKGYALDFALKELETVPADAVLFLDADSRPARDYLAVMARHWKRGGVVQGCYDTWSTRETWFSRLTALSFSLRNRRVFPAFDRLGWPIPLRGTGMLFDRSLIRETGWSVHGLTEDLEMTLILIARGSIPSYAPTAVCEQYMPSFPSEAGGQRQRWSAGEKSFRRTLFRREFPRALREGRWGRACSYLYLAAPGMSVQLFLFAVLVLCSFPVSAALGGLALTLFAVYGLYVLSAAPRFDGLTFVAMAMIPVYAAWRVFRAGCSRIGVWQRTKRPGEYGE